MPKRIQIPRKTYGIERFDTLLPLSYKQLESLLEKLETLLDKEQKKCKRNVKDIDLYESLIEDVKKLMDPFDRRMIISIMPIPPLTEEEKKEIQEHIKAFQKYQLLCNRTLFCDKTNIHTTMPSQSVKYTDNNRSIECAATHTRRKTK